MSLKKIRKWLVRILGLLLVVGLLHVVILCWATITARHHNCGQPLIVNLKNLESFAIQRQIDALRDGCSKKKAVPFMEWHRGLTSQGEAVEMLIVNNTNFADWQTHRGDAVLSLGVMGEKQTCEKREIWRKIMYVVTAKGIWRLEDGDDRFAAVEAEINLHAGCLESCSARAMGLGECPEEDGVCFARVVWQEEDAF